MSRTIAGVLGICAGAIFFVPACGESYPSCYAGEYRACTCAASGATGYQQCLASQDGYAACVCDGRTPVADASLGGAAPASKQYLEGCNSDAECVSHLCGLFPSRGNKCTKPCTKDDDCPPPSPGCNPQAICKSP